MEPEKAIVHGINALYGAGSFNPTAKIVAGKRYSIINDYLDTPTQMYDDNGTLVWECALDIYGKTKIKRGNLTDVPFRWQGQMEDEELGGLYYNRFRYYDSESGNYISQDPIGLDGNNPNFYAYVHDTNSWIDPLGLSPIFVNPNDINFSQRTVSEVRVFDASKYTPINVIEVDGQLVSYDCTSSN